MRFVHRWVLGIAVLAGAAACGGSSSCDEASDCPEITCDDGSTVQACIFGACATSCESSSGGFTTGSVVEADGG